MAAGFEQNFVIWGMGDPWTCVRNMLGGVWWFDPIYAAIQGFPLVGLETILTETRSIYAGVFALTELLALESILSYTFRQCLSWRCIRPKQASCSCVTKGYIADTWQCTCDVGSMIFNDAYKEFYQTSPPTGENSVYDGQLW
jgi:hypothetical protein